METPIPILMVEGSDSEERCRCLLQAISSYVLHCCDLALGVRNN